MTFLFPLRDGKSPATPGAPTCLRRRTGLRQALAAGGLEAAAGDCGCSHVWALPSSGETTAGWCALRRCGQQLEGPNRKGGCVLILPLISSVCPEAE